MYLVEVSDWTPALSDEAFLRDIEVEHVECVVDGFDLAHLDEPDLDVLSGGDQHTVTVILCLLQNLWSRTKGKGKGANTYDLRGIDLPGNSKK